MTLTLKAIQTHSVLLDGILPSVVLSKTEDNQSIHAKFTANYNKKKSMKIQQFELEVQGHIWVKFQLSLVYS